VHRNRASLLIATLCAWAALLARDVACAATASNTVSVEIVPACTILPTTTLDFGGRRRLGLRDVVVAPGNDRLDSGVQLRGGPGAAGNVTVRGIAESIYSIALPRAVVVARGGERLTVDRFTARPVQDPVLGGTGYERLAIGATLRVGPIAPRGTYRGTFDVTLVYN
jgi:Domain of unknown function (DUF4402)